MLPLTRVREKRFGTLVKDTFCTTFSGVGDDARVSFFRNSVHNLSVAVQARVFQRKVGDEWFYISSTPHKTGICSVHCERFESVFTESIVTIDMMTDREFLQHYHGRRRRVYENAFATLLYEPLTANDANCKCFLKKEKDIMSDKPDAVPRVITFPDPRYGMQFGKFVKAIESKFFASIDHCFGSRTVMKGLNYLTLGQEIFRKWDRFTDPCSIDGDVSRLDSSISDEMQQMYHKFAAKFFEYNERQIFLELCEMQLNVDVKGRAQDGGISFQSSGLGSGQMNTSQMGVFIVCYILWNLIDSLGLDVEVVNCGDDFSIIGERATIHVFRKHAIKYFMKYNMVLKLEELNDVLEGLNFCQTNPVKVDGTYRMVRVPRQAIIKDSSSIDCLLALSQRIQFLHAISCTGIATHGGVPIFQEVYRFMARASHGMRARITSKRSLVKTYKTKLYDHSMSYWGKSLTCSYKLISDETRYSFYIAFGISPVNQIAIEQTYRDMMIDDLPENFSLYSGDYDTPEYFGDKCLW